MRFAFQLFLAMLILPTGGADGATDRASVALQRHRSIMKAPESPAEVTLTYGYIGQGLTGTVETRFDTQTGAFVTASDLGVISVANGFDGVVPWMRDISGAYTAQEGGDRVELAVNEAYRNANLWWRSDRGGANVTYIDRQKVDGAWTDHLGITPRGGLRFEAWFDVKSGWLTAISERQLFFNTRTSYHDYKRRSGRMVATRVLSDGGTGPANVATMLLTQVELKPARKNSIYSRPMESPSGVTISDGKSTTSLPFRLLNNHIYIEGCVNGKGPYLFIVDTGGHTILSSRVVSEAGLTSDGGAPSAGAGQKIETSGYAPVREISFGAIRMSDQTAITMDIYDPEVEGIAVDGMVGFELFRRLAVRIDYATSILTFSQFDSFDATDAGVPIAFKFYDHLPQVDGRVGDIPAVFDIDTGSRSEADLTSPFVDREKLLTKFPRATKAMTGWGVGGPSMSEVVRIPSLAIGPVVVDSPVVGLSRAHAGSFSDANFDGNIGSGLLKRFVTSFDYSRQIMYLKPILPPPSDAGVFDRSGMWLNAADEGFVVAYVSGGGAAATAGIAEGDVIVSVNGKPAAAIDLSATRAMLRMRPSGERVLLVLRRHKKAIPVVLTLRDQLPPVAVKIREK